MAMAAWSAKVWTSLTCPGANRPGSGRFSARTKAPMTTPSLSTSGNAEQGAELAELRAGLLNVGIVLRVSFDIGLII